MGREEYERLVSSPNEPGDFLPAIVNYLKIESMSNSQIQQGTIDSHLEVNISQSESESIDAVLEKIIKVLNDQNMEEKFKKIIDVRLNELKTELANNKTNKLTIKEKIGILKDLFVLASTSYPFIETKIIPLIQNIKL